MSVPNNYTIKNGNIYNTQGKLVEQVDGKWLEVKDASRIGWWRYHEHYDRDGYCDNPGRGY